MRFLVRNKILVLVIILVIILVTAGSFFVITGSPKYKIKTAMSFAFEETKTLLNSIENSNETNLLTSGKLESNNVIKMDLAINEEVKDVFGPVTSDIEELVNDSTIQVNTRTNADSKYTEMDFIFTYLKEKAELNGYMDENYVYIYLKNYFDKYIKSEASSVNSAETLNRKVTISDAIVIMNLVEKSMNEAIEKANITSEAVTLDIEGEKVSTTKSTIKIDSKFMTELSRALMTNLLKDQKAKELVYEYTKESNYYTDITEFEEDIKSELSDLSLFVENEEYAEYSLYTNGMFANLVKQEINILGYDEFKVELTTYKTDKYDVRLVFTTSNNESVDTYIKETSKENYYIQITDGNGTYLKATANLNNKLFDLEGTIEAKGMEDISFNVKTEITNSSDTKIEQTFEFGIDAKSSFGTFKMTMDSEYNKLDNLSKKSIINSVNSEDLTDEDLSTIITNFQEKNPLTYEKIMNIVEQIM